MFTLRVSALRWAVLTCSTVLVVSSSSAQAQDPSSDQWTNGAQPATGTALLGRNAPTDQFNSTSIHGQPDRARAVVLDSVDAALLTDDRADANPLLVGLEVRERVENTAKFTVSGSDYAKNNAGVIGDAVRQGSTFQTQPALSIGLYGRTSAISDSWDSDNFATAKETPSKITAVGGAAGHFDPKNDEPCLRDGDHLKTGFVQNLFAGEFNVLADNLHFDGTNASTDYSCKNAIGAAATLWTGYFQNAPEGKKYGAHVENSYNVWTATILDGLYDKLDKAYGVYVGAPVKKSYSTNTATQLSDAAAALPESYGVFIAAPSPPQTTATLVTPSNYVGLQCNAPANFSELSTFNNGVTVNSDLWLDTDFTSRLRFGAPGGGSAPMPYISGESMDGQLAIVSSFISAQGDMEVGGELSVASNTWVGGSLTAVGAITGPYNPSQLSAAVPANKGGTGLTSPGTAGNVLTSNGSGWVSAAIPNSHQQNTDTGTNSSTFTILNGQDDLADVQAGILVGAPWGIQHSFLWDYNGGSNIWSASDPVSAPSFQGSGSNLTALNASNVSAGTLNSARLPAGSSFTQKFTVSESSFNSSTTNGAAGNITIGAPTPNFIVQGVYVNVTTQFSGGGLTSLSLQVGKGAGQNQYLTATTISGAAAEYFGSAVNTGSGVRSTHNIVATLTPDASHNLAAMTQGSVDIYVTYNTLP